MAWTTPKTDWYGVTNPSDGVYTGDRFNAVDFNRIITNTLELTLSQLEGQRLMI